MSSVRIIQAGEAPPVADPAAAFAAQPAPLQPAPVADRVPAAPRPSEIMARSNARQPIPIVLPSGRRVTVRPLSALERMFAFKAMGSELVTNLGYCNYALVACSVTEIDGSPTAMPTSNATIEVIIQRLGDDFDDLTELMKTAFTRYEVDEFDRDTVKN